MHPARKIVVNQSLRAGKPLIIAIDGPAGAGKSTVARKVAQELGYLYIDTGAMYRAAAWLILQKNIDPNDQTTVAALISTAKIELRQAKDIDGPISVLINGHEVTAAIRKQAVTHLVSPLATQPAVRQHMVKQQQQMAASGGVVMDGRDIGTVVLPEADLKIFLTATPEVRAKRRWHDLANQGEQADINILITEIRQRDERDSTRAVGPLKLADDAITIDTDSSTIDSVVATIINYCQQV